MQSLIAVVHRRGHDGDDCYRLVRLVELDRRVALNVTDDEGHTWRVIAVGRADQVVELDVGLAFEGWLVAWLGLRALATDWRLQVASQRLSEYEAAERLTWRQLAGERPVMPALPYRCDGWLEVTQ